MESSSASSSSSALLAGSSSPSSSAGEEEDVPSPPPPPSPPKKYIRDTQNGGKLKINSEYELYMKSKMVLSKAVAKSIVTTATISSLSTSTNTTPLQSTIPTTPLQSTTTTTPNNSVVIVDESSTIISSQSSQSQSSQLWVPIIATTTTAAATTTAITNGTTAAVTTMTMTAEEEADNEINNDHYINEEDCDEISLAYLARLSREVYNFDNTITTTNTNTNKSNDNNDNTNEIIEVGPDKFTIHILNDSDNDNGINETSKSQSNKANSKRKGNKILIISICGTFSPIQHIMNIMPHAYQTLYTVKEMFNNNDGNSNGNRSSLKDVQSSMKSLTHKDDNDGSNAGQNEQEYDAYTAGHEHGWTEPARKIYEEILIRVCGGSSLSDDDTANAAGSADTAGTATTATADLNDLFDKIIITGHSRGGLLAYYVGLNLLNNINAPPQQQQPQQQPQSYNGPIIRVIGFGMPSPLKEVSDNDCITKHFIQNNVISVINRYDPVANNTLPTITTTPLVNWWNPILVEIGSKIKKKPPIQKPKESSKKKTTGSGLWGLVSNVVSIAVNAVTDKATELKYDIENNHTIYQYEQLMTINSNNTNNINGDNDNFVILPSCVVIINDDNDYNNDIDIGNSNSKSQSNSTSSPGTPSSTTSSTLQLLLPSSSK